MSALLLLSVQTFGLLALPPGRGAGRTRPLKLEYVWACAVPGGAVCFIFRA